MVGQAVGVPVDQIPRQPLLEHRDRATQAGHSPTDLGQLSPKSVLSNVNLADGVGDVRYVSRAAD
jgi:hypothetical protein